MTKLRESLLTSILPVHLRTADTKAFAYAINRQIQKLMTWADSTVLWPQIETLGEEVLDALAGELRTPNYRDDYPLDVKRSLVKTTLPFFMTAGTPQAMTEAIDAIFGAESSKIREWFMYDGKPYTFQAAVINPQIPGSSFQDAITNFIEICHKAKRLTAHLDGVEIITEAEPLEEDLNINGRYAVLSITVLPQLDLGAGHEEIRLRGGTAIFSETNLPDLMHEAVGTSLDLKLSSAKFSVRPIPTKIE